MARVSEFALATDLVPDHDGIHVGNLCGSRTNKVRPRAGDASTVISIPIACISITCAPRVSVKAVGDQADS